jgi:hypothetical protein
MIWFSDCPFLAQLLKCEFYGEGEGTILEILKMIWKLLSKGMNDFCYCFSDLPQTSKSKQKNMSDRLSPARISLPPIKNERRSNEHDYNRPT